MKLPEKKKKVICCQLKSRWPAQNDLKNGPDNGYSSLSFGLNRKRPQSLKYESRRQILRGPARFDSAPTFGRERFEFNCSLCGKIMSELNV